MIPAFLVEKYGPKVAAVIFWCIVGIAALLLAGGLYLAVTRHFTVGLKTQVAVEGAQLNAQAASGHDAVQTIGNVMGNDQATDTITQENGNAIDHAKGADAGVDPAARAAGLQALCRRASYRDTHPACVQQSPP